MSWLRSGVEGRFGLENIVVAVRQVELCDVAEH
jgi:hypothetical protein